jgi:hypothetical protein
MSSDQLEYIMIYFMVGFLVSVVAKRQGFWMNQWWHRTVAIIAWPIITCIILVMLLDESSKN